MHHSNRDLKVYGGIKLFAGTGSPGLAQEIAKYLEQPVSDREVIDFPNENIFIKLGGSVRGQDVYVIQTTSSPVHRNLMELLIMIQTLRLDSRLVADMLEVAGADRYMTLDPHAGQVQGFFSIPGDVLTASHLLVKHINKNMRADMKDPVVVSVDLGFAKKGRNYAADMDMPIAFIEKRRHGNDGKAEALTLIGEVKDHDVIIVDDEVDTGGSIAQAVDVVKQNGARNVYLAFVHAILSHNGAERLASLPIKHIITTDSAPLSPDKIKFLQDRITVLSVAPLLGEVIKRAHEGHSVGEMFNE
jgi:ribose-phosphate pyrophosphokinase